MDIVFFVRYPPFFVLQLWIKCSTSTNHNILSEDLKGATRKSVVILSILEGHPVFSNITVVPHFLYLVMAFIMFHGTK